MKNDYARYVVKVKLEILLDLKNNYHVRWKLRGFL